MPTNKKANKKSTDKKSPTMKQCLNYLHKPNMDRQPPLSCYRMLDFPDEPTDSRLKPGPHYQYLVKFCKNIKIGPALEVNQKNLKIYVPPKFRETVKSYRNRYVIIPVHFNNSNNTYGIFMDKSQGEIQVFIPPGNHRIPKHQQLELKFRSLFVDRLNIPVVFFYHAINYAPPPNTYHADFWPSWLIYQRINKSIDRERLVNHALEKILRQDTEYSNFVKKYTNYIIDSS